MPIFLLRLKFDNDVMIKLGRAARLWNGTSLRGHKWGGLFQKNKLGYKCGGLKSCQKFACSKGGHPKINEHLWEVSRQL